jgi:RNA polymerase sigma-70 factor (ECF subfamily)
MQLLDQRFGLSAELASAGYPRAGTLVIVGLPRGDGAKTWGVRGRSMPVEVKNAKSSAELAGLIEAIASHHDREAFGTLFDHFAPRIKSFLMLGGTPAGTAEDLAQEALLMIWRKAGQFDRTRAGASAWVFAIARNLRIDKARRDQRARLLEFDTADDADPPQPPDSAVIAVERDARVRKALEMLSDDQINVVRLSFFEGKAHANIADELKLPLGTVKSRLRLAMKRLREALVDLT